MENQHRVLFVEDDPQTRRAFHRTLKSPEVAVDTCSGFEEALQAARTNDYDLVATDYHMPEANGFEVARAVRTLLPAARFVLVTGDRSTDLAERAIRDEGFALVLGKPWDARLLGQMVSEAPCQAGQPSIEAYVALVHQAQRNQNRDNRKKSSAVRRLTQALSRSARLPSPVGHALSTASETYDVGMLAVPPRLVRKHGVLAPEERGMIETHVQHSANAVARMGYHGLTHTIVAQHHEHFDGSGYPNNLHGEAIHQGARILRLADTVVSMQQRKIHRSAEPVERVRDFVQRESGRRFDPSVVSMFLQLPSHTWKV